MTFERTYSVSQQPAEPKTPDTIFKKLIDKAPDSIITQPMKIGQGVASWVKNSFRKSFASSKPLVVKSPEPAKEELYSNERCPSSWGGSLPTIVENSQRSEGPKIEHVDLSLE